MTPATFVAMAEEIRTWCWAPMATLGPGEVPDPLPPRLAIIEDNYACWLWMRGEHERALAVPDLEPELVTALKRLAATSPARRR